MYQIQQRHPEASFHGKSTSLQRKDHVVTILGLPVYIVEVWDSYAKKLYVTSRDVR